MKELYLSFSEFIKITKRLRVKFSKVSSLPLVPQFMRNTEFHLRSSQIEGLLVSVLFFGKFIEIPLAEFNACTNLDAVVDLLIHAWSSPDAIQLTYPRLNYLEIINSFYNNSLYLD